MRKVGNTVYLDGSEINPFACILIAEELERLEVDKAEIRVRGKKGAVKITAEKMSDEDAAAFIVVPNV